MPFQDLGSIVGPVRERRVRTLLVTAARRSPCCRRC